LPELLLTRRAKNDLAGLARILQEAVLETLTLIEANPQAEGKELRGRLRGLWSCRVGNYRILYNNRWTPEATSGDSSHYPPQSRRLFHKEPFRAPPAVNRNRNPAILRVVLSNMGAQLGWNSTLGAPNETLFKLIRAAQRIQEPFGRGGLLSQGGDPRGGLGLDGAGGC